MRRLALPLFCLLAAGCGPTSTYRPAVDLAGMDRARYEIDLYDCKKVAERDRYGPVLAGALLGAGVGGAIAAPTAMLGGGNIGLATSYGAIAGTVGGTAVGATQVQGPLDEKAFVDQCLRNNGYKLLKPAADQREDSRAARRARSSMPAQSPDATASAGAIQLPPTSGTLGSAK
jgi:hypothetical protein